MRMTRSALVRTLVGASVTACVAIGTVGATPASADANPPPPPGCDDAYLTYQYNYQKIGEREERIGYGDAGGGEVHVYYQYAVQAFGGLLGWVPFGTAERLCESYPY